MYTTADLKKQFKKFAAAKKHFGVKAQSWEKLCKKLNEKANQESEVEQLRSRIQFLEAEIAKKNSEFDEIGFWLLDNNFDRSRFSDFNLPENATKLESVAKGYYKKLAGKYHPDKGGTAMQMANLNKLLEQMMALVELNNGLGK